MFGVDDALLAAGITAAGSAVGSWWSARSAAEGQREANLANVSSARELADWQERMSNTSMQRRVADYKAAGVNPLFGVGSGGAPVPGGAMATQQSSRPDYGRGLSSAAAVVQNELQNRLLLAQIKATQQQARKTGADATHSENLIPKTAAEGGLYTGWGQYIPAIEKAIEMVSGVSPIASGIGGLFKAGAGRLTHSAKSALRNNYSHDFWERFHS